VSVAARIAAVLVVVAAAGFDLSRGSIRLPVVPPLPFIPGKSGPPPARATPTTSSRAAATAIEIVQPTPGPTQTPAPTPTPEAANFIVLRARDLTREAHLNVVGQGFIPSEKLSVTIEDSKGKAEAELDALDADPSGRLNDAGVELPATLGAGEHRIKIEGQTSGRVARATFQLHRKPPTIELAEYSIKSDNDIAITGSGFAANEDVEVRLGGLSGEPLAILRASATGQLVAQTAHVPRVQAGDYPLYVVGRVSQTPASVGLNVRGFTPWVVLDNYSPVAYYRMGFKGEDFAPNEEVLVYLGDTQHDPDARVYADATGHVDAQGVLPLPELHGETQLFFRGQITRSLLTASFNALGFQPGLELTNYAARPGAQVGFTGTDWARSDTLHAFLGDVSGKTKLQQVATFQADEAGAFHDQGTFRVPATMKAGGLPLTVVGDFSKAEVTIYFEVLPIKASAELTSYRGPSGTTVAFSGNGFAGGEGVTIHLRTRDGDVLATANANGEGSFGTVGSYSVVGNPGDEATPFVFVGNESGAEAMTHFKIAEPSP
jgi:hypothetical protein